MGPANLNAPLPVVGDAHFRQLVASVRDYAIFLLDPIGRVLTWNIGAERIKGWRAEEIIGRHFSTFYPDSDVRAGKCEMELIAAVRDRRFEDEGWRLRKDGTRFWANVVITALFDEGGQHLGFAKVTRDLTDRRRAEESLRESEQRFRLLIESVRDYAIFMLDPSGIVTTWNAGAERINGWRADEIIGQHFSTFYPDEDVALGKCERELAAATRDGRFEDEGWRVRKDGSRIWMNVVISALRAADGRLIGFGKVTRDLTERRRAEEERVRLAQAQEAIRLRDEFLSIASHELKTPLTSVRLQLESAQRVLGDEGPAAGKVARARKGSERLSELIETLLDVSRLATGRMSLRREPVDLGETVRDVCERFREQAGAAGSELAIEIRPGQGLVGEWDRLRVEQVVTNLLANAAKYAAGTTIRVTVEGGADALVVVEDGGPGVEAKDLERIFERFERAAPMRQYGGLGLGLYVARQIVEGHGGRIDASNLPSGGARFVVRLPRHAPGETSGVALAPSV